ncbi:MAG: hypothetical protein AB7O65_02025 [Candidatus Korobacteraceae bacterium]
MRIRILSSVSLFFLFLLFPLTGSGQAAKSPAQQKPAQSKQAKSSRRSHPPAPARVMNARKKFVLDVVNAAVSLPQGDPQDRLRVLASAANVVSSVDSERAKEFADEGVQLEMQLVASGQTPAVSIMQRGQMKCSVAQDFVEMLPVAHVSAAEESLLGALSTCSKETLDPVKRKLKDGLQNNVLAPRALLAVMEAEGLRAPWSIEQFQALFSSLPKDAEKVVTEAPHYAAMFARVAPEVGPDVAGKAGVNFLEWLGRLEQGDERNLAVNITASVLQEVMGSEEKYKELLGSNVMAMQVAQTEGQAAEVGHEDEETVSVLRALDNNGSDQSETLRDMPASIRAREAAAHGFATGTGGDPESAKNYFDMAFAALNEVWEQRSTRLEAAEIVEEVSEAAAHVDPATALQRTQGLADSSAQAIGMLAVARVALSRQVPEEARGQM